MSTRLWTHQDLLDSTYAKVVKLTKDGLSVKDIIGSVDVGNSTVNEHLGKARKKGALPPKGSTDGEGE